MLIIQIFLLTLALVCSLANPVMKLSKAVFSIPYTTSFRTDKLNQAMGCGHNVIYGTYLYPQENRDALHFYLSPYHFGGTGLNCKFKWMFARAFGTAQDYSILKSPEIVAKSIKDNVEIRFKDIIVDWKKPIDDNLANSRQYLNSLVQNLTKLQLNVYLKAPASHFCRDIDGKPYILGVDSAQNFIIEMYGESINTYKTVDEIFLKESGQIQEHYPTQECPRFPSLTQLNKKYPDKNFFIEKTLQTEQSGYLGKDFLAMVETFDNQVGKFVFFDAYPPNLIQY